MTNMSTFCKDYETAVLGSGERRLVVSPGDIRMTYEVLLVVKVNQFRIFEELRLCAAIDFISGGVLC